VHLPPGFLAPVSQSFQKALAVNIIDENVLPPVSPIHDVVNCALTELASCAACAQGDKLSPGVKEESQLGRT